MICDRCKKKTLSSIGSYFNMDQICFACREIEEMHPDFERAREIETREVGRGNYNFPGIGLPTNLDTSYRQRRLTNRLENDPEFRAEYEAAVKEIGQVDI